jgi:hypothetical protein
METNGKHTAGPWHYDHTHNSHPGAHRVVAPDGAIIADYGWLQRFNEAEANARLIAAAPELLEAAWQAIEALNTGSDSDYVAMRIKAKQILAAAINKAEGMVTP